MPLYSIESWLSLRYRRYALYIETVRECYESYVLYSFMYFLIAVLGEESSLTGHLIKSKGKERGQHLPPMSLLLSTWEMDHTFIRRCKFGVLQYVVIKLLLAAVVFVLESVGVYDEGVFSLRRGYIFVIIVTYSSQMWALYCLSMFYKVFRDDLAPWRPIGKFLCVKSVVPFLKYVNIG